MGESLGQWREYQISLVIPCYNYVLKSGLTNSNLGSEFAHCMLVGVSDILIVCIILLSYERLARKCTLLILHEFNSCVNSECLNYEILVRQYRRKQMY